MSGAWGKTIADFPKADPRTARFTARLGEKGKPEVMSTAAGTRGVYRQLFQSDSTLNPKLGKTIIGDLGPHTPIEIRRALDRHSEVIRQRDEKIARLRENIRQITETHDENI